ncbi:MAG: hypothetical protein D6786_07395 [Gammaproteobacteria bacterium]|nr:MAG: hypothetical protein D6786_07395 [Gammaproteobacteria bacterium]
MTTNLTSPVSARLEAIGIPFEWIGIPLDPERKPIRSLEDLMTSRGMTPAQIVRSLLFRAGSGGFILLAAPATARVDWAALRRALGERRLTMATPEQVLEVTGYPVGAVPPLALPESVTVLADESIFTPERVVIGSGLLGWAIELAGAGLDRALAGTRRGRFV